MAGISSRGVFDEKISVFLRNKMNEVRTEYGEDSGEYQALSLQYLRDSEEGMEADEHNRRHWEADLLVENEEHELKGMERLYNKTIVVEPTMICIAHCRYCLRGNYDIFTLKEEDLYAIAKYCGTVGKESGLNEILITGGDPLVVPNLLDYFIECLMELAPNIRIIRIATRIITHDPARIGNSFYKILDKKHDGLRFEIATQINHAIEFFPESIEVIKEIQSHGATIYSQNVLLRGVNDNLDDLVNLYNTMRINNVDPHYLFHCVPLKGMHHLRTTVQKGLDLTIQMENSGYISGRAKPIYALMTDIGKVVLYQGSIVKNSNDGYIELKTAYKLKDRLAWNPSWKLPETASVDDDGYIRIRYLDGVYE